MTLVECFWATPRCAPDNLLSSSDGGDRAAQSTDGSQAAEGDSAKHSSSGDLYGAFAFSQEEDGGYSGGAAWDYGSLEAAQNKAMQQCIDQGGSNCENAGWFQNTCGALAISDDGNGVASEGGDTLEDAKRNAIKQCNSINDSYSIEIAHCLNN